MKKIKWIAILFAIVVSMVFVGCSNPANNGGSSSVTPPETNFTPEITFNYQESGKGSLAKKRIAIDGKTYAKTAEVVMIPADETAVVNITDDSSWNTYYSGSNSSYKGVFLIWKKS